MSEEINHQKGTTKPGGPMLAYHAYAAPSAKAPLEPFNFDPGPLVIHEITLVNL